MTTINLETKTRQTLFKYFGYKDFRPGQLAIVLSILKKQNTLAILPTGGGKSICFQIPALIFPGTSIIISPLISLMKDQVDHLLAKNIPATFINSNLEKKEIAVRLKNLNKGKYKFLYLAPERLSNPKLIKICQEIKISMLCVDEAHCISMWAHQFRPAYKKIPEFLEKIQKKEQKITISAFTATATPLVKKEIKQFLELKPCREFSKSFLRENLIFHNLICQNSSEKNIYLFKLLKIHQGENGVIYCSTRRACEKLYKLIKDFSFQEVPQIAFYHGGMDKEKRAQVQEKFLNGKLKIIIATNAFGMGVDKADVRFVIHYQVSANLENYYQEAGRAGRDSQTSYCYLLYTDFDLNIQMGLIKKSFQDNPQHPRLDIENYKLQEMQRYAASKSCLEKIILEYFTKTSSKNKQCKHCANCLNRHLYLNPEEVKKINRLLKIAIRLQEKLSKKYPLFGKQTLLLPSILHQQSIESIALLNPKSVEQLIKIPGISNAISDLKLPEVI